MIGSSSAGRIASRLFRRPARNPPGLRLGDEAEYLHEGGGGARFRVRKVVDLAWRWARREDAGAGWTVDRLGPFGLLVAAHRLEPVPRADPVAAAALGELAASPFRGRFGAWSLGESETKCGPLPEFWLAAPVPGQPDPLGCRLDDRPG